jgi:hypothetical protein
MMLHLQHFNFTQSASLIPVFFITLQNFLNKKNLAWAIISALVLSQMLFAGFVQIYAYSVIVFFIFTVAYVFFGEKAAFKKIVASYAGIVLFSVLLSAAQLLPSYELIKLSPRSAGVNSANILNDFPLLPKNYLTYLDPFILGKASNGTYNNPQWSKNGIFWENTAYVGLIPLAFFFIGVAFLFSKKRRGYLYPAVLVAVIAAVLLSLGKYSPLHILFSVPPLNFFRVPARFILFVQFFMVIISAYGIKNLKDKIPKNGVGIILSMLTLAVALNIYFYWLNYNPVGPAEKWLATPPLAEKIKSGEGRVVSFGTPKYWNEIFTQKGWEGQSDYYYFFRNSLDQNINLLYGQNQFAMFENLPTRRYQLQQTIINDGIKAENNVITIAEKAGNLLRFSNVKYMISSVLIETPNARMIDSVSKDGYRYFLYEIENTKPLFGLYYDFKNVETVNDYWELTESVDIAKTLLLEDTKGLSSLQKGSGTVDAQKIENGEFSFKVSTTTDALLSLANTYYPGWQAKIDGQKTEILAANINAQAVLVPQGEHTVEFKYAPGSFKTGLAISTTAHMLAFFYLLKKKFAHRLV